MIVLFGKKNVFKKIGHVADFCPVCRDLRPFELQRVGEAMHIYYLSFGEGELIGYRKVCDDCQCGFEAELERYQKVREQPAALEILIQETYPGLRQTYGVRLEQEARLAATPGALNDTERMRQIRAAFDLLAPNSQAAYEHFHFDREVLLSMVGALIVMCVGGGLGNKILPESPAVFPIIGLFVAGGLLFSQLAGVGDRYMMRVILPQLATVLRALKPSKEELTRALGTMEREGYKMGSKLKPEMIEDTIRLLERAPKRTG